jgi:hypothetical protein
MIQFEHAPNRINKNSFIHKNIKIEQKKSQIKRKSQIMPL